MILWNTCSYSNGTNNNNWGKQVRWCWIFYWCVLCPLIQRCKFKIGYTVHACLSYYNKCILSHWSVPEVYLASWHYWLCKECSRIQLSNGCSRQHWVAYTPLQMLYTITWLPAEMGLHWACTFMQNCWWCYSFVDHRLLSTYFVVWTGLRWFVLLHTLHTARE